MLVQCIIKIKDIGNSYEYQGLIEDNTNYISQYDVDVEYQDIKENEEPTIDYVIAYHKDGEEEFFDEDGITYDFDEPLNEGYYTVTIDGEPVSPNFKTRDGARLWAEENYDIDDERISIEYEVKVGE